MMHTGCQAIKLHKVNKNISYLESFSHTYDTILIFSHILMQKAGCARTHIRTAPPITVSFASVADGFAQFSILSL